MNSVDPQAVGRAVGGASDEAQARDWLCALLRGESPAPPRSPGVAACLFVVAQAEGIVGLVEGTLDAIPASGIPAAVRRAFATEAHRLVAQGLSRDATARRVLARLLEASLPVLVLKGAALVHWLYPSSQLRVCGDIDLLLPDRGTVDQALVALADLGYSASVRVVPGDLVAYELMARPTEAGAAGWELDLHWRLSNTPLFAQALDFDTLSAASRPLAALGEGARGLGAVHALCHAAIHRAVSLQFGDTGHLRWLYDLHLLARTLGEAEWRDLEGIAAARGLSGVCLDGLQSTKDAFGTLVPPDTLAFLAEAACGEPLDTARMRSWAYVQLATWRALPTLRLRLRWLRQRVFPNPDFLRQSDPAANGSWLRLFARRLRAGIARVRRAP